ncbi:hypothetical protein [Rhodococcus koreensis]
MPEQDPRPQCSGLRRPLREPAPAEGAGLGQLPHPAETAIEVQAHHQLPIEPRRPQRIERSKNARGDPRCRVGVLGEKALMDQADPHGPIQQIGPRPGLLDRDQRRTSRFGGTHDIVEHRCPPDRLPH